MTMANAVKALGARATMSSGDIRSRLHEDHVQFKKWTKKMAEGERTDERARSFAQLKPALTAHARIEEVLAYDSLIKTTSDRETDTLGREGYVEHHLADHLVERLTELDPATDEWLAHAKVLHEILGHHIQEEETDIFAKLGDQFSREELEALGTRFEQQKASFVPPPSGSRSRPAAPRQPVRRKTATRATSASRPVTKKSAVKKAAKKTAKRR